MYACHPRKLHTEAYVGMKLTPTQSYASILILVSFKVSCRVRIPTSLNIVILDSKRTHVIFLFGIWALPTNKKEKY